MSGPRSKRALQALLTLLGIVAVGAGSYAVLTGVAGMPGDAPIAASVDSELRFFGAFYIAFGAVALWLAPRVDTQTRLLRALSLTLFVAGLARGASWLDVGRPDDLFVALMIVELAVPPVIVVWQGRVIRVRGEPTSRR